MAGKAEDIILENLKSIEEWALSGISQKEMAELLGMSYSTFREQKKKISALSALLKKCADFLNQEKLKQVGEVEISLFKRCIGYNAKVLKNYKVKRPARNGEGDLLTDSGGKAVMEEILEERTEETHVPADVSAIKFFLLNMARKDWKNDPERLDIDKKRLANDTKRTKLAESAAGFGGETGQCVEDFLQEVDDV